MPLPGLDKVPDRPYGAPSDEGIVAGDLLHVPALARGEPEIVAIARRRGVLSKVAVRRRRGVKLSARPVTLVVGVGADYVRRVSAELGGERVHVLQWQGDPGRYIAEALGLSHLPPMELSPTSRLANVLLGDIAAPAGSDAAMCSLLTLSRCERWRPAPASMSDLRRDDPGRTNPIRPPVRAVEASRGGRG